MLYVIKIERVIPHQGYMAHVHEVVVGIPLRVRRQAN